MDNGVRAMKIVLLADLHGNMAATKAMEQELERIRPDEVYFLGDAIGKGPESDKTCDWVRMHCDHWLAGNWDRKLSEKRDQADYAFYTTQIGPERFAWLDSLPFKFKDGRPDADGMICADCHRPFIRPLEGGYALNTGSVGDNLSLPRAHALLLEGEKEGGPLHITVLSVPYDNQKAVETADLYPDLPLKEAFQKEVLTGIYSR